MIVNTTSGPVAGFERDGVVQYRGVPFARTAAGSGRWRPPESPEPWTAVHPADRYGPIAPQNPSPLESLLGAPSRPKAEDCLTLNVLTPAPDDRARPVMVWIHGGAFHAGAGSLPWYNGARLVARGDVVFVSVNYRLGALGWLHLADLLGNEFATSGNTGLLDQVAALEWVRDNIAAFGGDPDRVTVFGESAGAMSIGALLGSPTASGLFQGAILESGASHNVFTAEAAAAVADDFVREVGLTRSSADGLLEVPVETLLAAQMRIATRLALPPRDGGSAWGSLPFQPVVDGNVLPTPPLDAVAGGSASGVSLLAGTNRDEWTMFHVAVRQAGGMSEEELRRRCQRVFAAHGDATGDRVVETYRRERPQASADDLWEAIATDGVFRLPAIRLVEAQAAHSPHTFMYRFDYRSTAWGGALGSTHGVEIPFVFDNLHRAGVDTFLGSLHTDAPTLAALTSGAWLAFAHRGVPGHEGLPPWPVYDTERRSTMTLGLDRGVIEDPGRAERELWDGVV